MAARLPFIACLLVSLGVDALAAVTIERFDPRLERILAPEAVVERLADGLQWVEGPVWNRADGSLLFSDIPANVIYRWTPADGLSVFLTPSGYFGADRFAGREPGSNGLAIDRAGRLVICEHGNRRVSLLDTDGRRRTLVERYRGKRLNSPNDVAIATNGDLYFTDPPFGLPQAFADPARELGFSGVYRLSSAGELTLLTDELAAPNGIALSPDESVLYLSDVDPAHSAWLAYPLGGDGSLGAGRVLFDATSISGSGRGAPDGIEVDYRGYVYGAGPGGVFIFDPEGQLLGLIRTGVSTANLAWGEDGTVLYIAANTAIYRVPTLTHGAHFPATGELR